MSQYYYLVTGLPELSLEDSKLGYSVADFKALIYPQLSFFDRKVADLFFLRFDNENVLKLLRDKEAQTDARGNFSSQTYADLFKQMEQSGRIRKSLGVPSYLVSFIQDNFQKEEADQEVLVEDRLAASYYAYAMGCKNAFMRSWFEFNMNVSNIMVAMTARKHRMAYANLIIGQTPVSEALRTSSAQRDFGLSQELDYMDQVIKMGEIEDLVERERKMDALRWKWLEDKAFFEAFSVERLMVFLLETDMIERWVSLDREKGSQMFREIIASLKSEVKVPQEF